MFPLAFGLFDTETKENWIWFMEQLGKAIGPLPRLAVCTDACKGLEAAVKACVSLGRAKRVFQASHGEHEEILHWRGVWQKHVACS
jgi:hypothetical protein